MADDYGFDVQRLDLSWSALEPTRGVIDQAYLAQVLTAVDQAARHGIYTVLDMHQDTYSKFVTATAGTTPPHRPPPRSWGTTVLRGGRR